MKARRFSRIAAVIMAVVICLVMAVPSFAATSVVAPLASLNIKAGTDGYTLSPSFQKNTQVYTLYGPNTSITSAEDVEALIEFTPDEGMTIQSTAYNAAVKLYSIVVANAEDSSTTSTYYISLSNNLKNASDKPKAYINLTKVLKTEMKVGEDGTPEEGFTELMLDNLSFTFKLTEAGVIPNTTPVGYNTASPNPLPADGATNSGTEETGTAVIENQGSYATMVLDNWDGDDVATVNNENAQVLTEKYFGRKFINGQFAIEYTGVGQYKYFLEEVVPDTENQVTGVKYDGTKYEIIVSVVNADPANPDDENLCIGWIEVREITSYTNANVYTVGPKVNFGTGVDGVKYDNDSTSVYYPFVNILATDNLYISKNVTGDLGDKDQQFLFKVTVEGVGLAKNYAVFYNETDAEAVRPELTGDATDGNTKTVVYFTLKDGMNAAIVNLPVGVSYTVEEIVDPDATQLDSAEEAANYNTTITYDDSVGTTEMVKAVVVSKTVSHGLLDSLSDLDTNIVEVVNDKPLTPPTGAFVDMIPYIAIVVVALGGLAAFFVIRKRKNAFED